MKKERNSFFRNTFYLYFSTIAICITILSWSLKLWQADINIPFTYSNDGLLTGGFIKGIIDNPWFLTNHYIGSPNIQELFDYPMADNFHFIILKIIALITNDYVLTLNIYYLLGFILTTVSSFSVLRQFNISYWPSLMVSLLFTFLPYHFLRFNIGHLFLASYYIIPLIVMVIIWAYVDKSPLFFSEINENNKYKFSIRNRKSIISILVCLIVASSGVYYAFFACALLFTCVVSLIFNKSSKYNLLSLVILTFTIIIGLVINISPTLINNFINGKNLEVATRSSAEADIYGLKISQLLIPISDHGINIIAKIKTLYSFHPLSSEGSAYIGAVGGIGFIILLFWLIKPREFNERNRLLNTLAILNIAALLIATIGGFGSLFALLISPQIRGYNRISVYIAFISLFAFGIFINNVLENYKKSKSLYSLFVFTICVILCIGIIDQTDRAFAPNYSQIKEEFNSDAKFVKNIENTIPKGSMIFQLPYVPYPENPRVNKMNDYDLMKGYLHSKSLYWSYGAMKGSQGDEWLKDISIKPLNEFIEAISFTGFNGLYLDRNGYTDNGSELEAKLNLMLAEKPLESPNKRLIFYNLKDFNIDLKNKYTEGEWNLKRENILHPILITWRNSTLEGTVDNNWRWFPTEAELEINNTSNKDVKITIQMGISTGYDEISNLLISGPLYSESIMVNSSGKIYSKTVVIPKGKHSIMLRTDAKQVYAPADPRTLVFRITNFRLIVEK